MWRASVLLDSRVRLEWAAQRAGITSDAGAYEGNKDGVHAKIFYHDGGCSKSGDMVFVPDMQKKNGPRKLVFKFPATSPIKAVEHRSAPFLNFRSLMQLGSDVRLTAGETSGATVGRDAKLEEKAPAVESDAAAQRSLEFPELTALRPTFPVRNNTPAGFFEWGQGRRNARPWSTRVSS